MPNFTAIAVLERAVLRLRALSSFTSSEDELLADALAAIVATASPVPGAIEAEPEELVSVLRGLQPRGDESRTWIRKLRGEIAAAFGFEISDYASSPEDEARLNEKRDQALAAAEDRTAEKIASFLDRLADRAACYLSPPTAPIGLHAAAQDVRDGRWR